MRDFTLTRKQAEALYMWIQTEYINYEREILINLVKQLREYLSSQERETGDE